MGLPRILGQHDVVLLQTLTPRCSGGVLGHASVPQQPPPSHMPLQAYANYVMGLPQVGVFFRVDPPTVLYITCLVLFWCLLSTFICHAGFHIHPLGLKHRGLHHCNNLGVYLWQAYVQPSDGHQPMSGMHRVAAPCTTLSRAELYAAHSVVTSHPI